MGIEQQIAALDEQVGQLRKTVTKFTSGASEMTIGEIATSLDELDVKLEALSWSRMKEISDDQSITAEDLRGYIGQTVMVNISGRGDYEFRCVGVRHDERSDGAGKAAFSFMCVKNPYYRRIDPESSINGGFQDSELFDFLESDAFGSLPDELQTAISPVDKLYNSTPKGQSTKVSTKIWIASEMETFGENEYGTNGSQYDFWSQGNSLSGVVDYWYLRDVADVKSNGYADRFAAVKLDGGKATLSLTYNYGVVPGFCI